MAATYIVRAPSVALANNKHMITIWNGSGSGKIVKISRIWLINERVAAVTGIITRFFMYKMTADGSDGTTLTPVAYDTSSASVPAQIVCRTGPTTAITYDSNTLYRSVCFSSDEYGVGDATIDGVETMTPIMVVWDTGYGEDELQFLTLREGEGLTFFHGVNSTAGTVNLSVEFMLE